jgi:hypothetical protein
VSEAYAAVDEISDRLPEACRPPEQNYLSLMEQARAASVWRPEKGTYQQLVDSRRTLDYRSKHC